MERDQARLAATAGRLWAERKAETLRDGIPAADWPDLWDDAEQGSLPFSSSELAGTRGAALETEALHAAHERWRELVVEQRNLEADQEQEPLLELDAVRLETALQNDLPHGISVGREGSRVYLEETRRGMQRSVTSLEQAWRVVDEWEESRRPGV